MKNISKNIKKGIVYVATTFAALEANTTCPLINHHPKEPQGVKRLRKF